MKENERIFEKYFSSRQNKWLLRRGAACFEFLGIQWLDFVFRLSLLPLLGLGIVQHPPAVSTQRRTRRKKTKLDSGFMAPENGTSNRDCRVRGTPTMPKFRYDDGALRHPFFEFKLVSPLQNSRGITSTRISRQFLLGKDRIGWVIRIALDRDTFLTFVIGAHVPECDANCARCVYRRYQVFCGILVSRIAAVVLERVCRYISTRSSSTGR